MDEIAARVGVAKGTVYLHFPGKDELIAAIFVNTMQKILQSVNEVAALQVSTRVKLESILRLQYGGLYKKRVQLFSSMYTGNDFRRLIETKQCSIKEIWEQLTAIITRLVDEGKASGEVNPTIPTSIMVGVFFSLQSPHIHEHLGLGTELPVDDLVNYLSAIYFNGVSSH